MSHPYCQEHDQPLEWCAHYRVAQLIKVLEDRIGALENRVRELERDVQRGPDPRLWSGDPHDGGWR
jgi:hypothetical protein